MGRPLGVWLLALVAVLAGLSALAIMLQFLDVLPDAGDEVQFFGGKWAGVVLYGVQAVVLFAVAFGWITLKPWAPMFTLLFALLGFFVPFMSYLAGTELISTALAPMILSVVIILLSMRGPVRQAMAEAAAARSAPKPVHAATPKPAHAAAPAAPKAAPVVRPKGFRSDDV